jgi:Flp pilus assembly protein TadB
MLDAERRTRWFMFIATEISAAAAVWIYPWAGAPLWVTIPFVLLAAFIALPPVVWAACQLARAAKRLVMIAAFIHAVNRHERNPR